MTNYLHSIGLVSVLALTPALASAATVTAGPGGTDDGYATEITYEDDNVVARRGVKNGRDNALNALGGPADGQFFEMGFGSTVDLTFGLLFDTTATLVEVTFGSVATFPETVDVYVGLGGVFTFAGSVSNSAAQTMATVSLAGLGSPFDTLRLVDTSPVTSTFEDDINGNPVGGFDIDAVRVAAVPVPAAGLLLLTALGGAAAMRRRKSKAA